MSRGRIRLGVILTLAILMNPQATRAQQIPSERESQLVEQLGRLQEHYRELRQADRVVDSINRVRRIAASRMELDTTAVGPFLVVAIPRQLDDAVEVLTAAWDALELEHSGWSPSGEAGVFRFHRTAEAFMPGSRAGVRVRPWYPRALAESRAGAAIERRVFTTTFPEGERQWTSSIGIRDGRTLEFAYRDLITTPSAASRDCFQDTADRCWDALGLRGTESSWSSWYDATERRLWANKLADDDRERRSCSAGTDAVCLAVVESRMRTAPIPTKAATRASFLGHVIRVGGDGALARLKEGGGATLLADRLIYTAGTPADQLIESWRAEVLRAAPQAQSGLPLKLLSGALLWSMVFSGFAMRSTRWRA